MQLNRLIEWMSPNSLMHRCQHDSLLLLRICDTVSHEYALNFEQVRKGTDVNPPFRVCEGLQCHVCVVVLFSEVEGNLKYQLLFDDILVVLLLEILEHSSISNLLKNLLFLLLFLLCNDVRKGWLD